MLPSVDPLPLRELRCSVAWRSETLVWDADLVTVAPDGTVTTIVLAQGADGDFGTGPDATLARAWLKGADDTALEDWPDSPSRLPADAPAGTWGSLVARSLAAAIGEDVLEGLLGPEAFAHGPARLVFRPADEASDRVPFETLVWPPTDRARHVVARGVSILRIADALGPYSTGESCGPFGAREPGRHRSVVLYAGGDSRDSRFAEPLARAVGAFDRNTTPLLAPLDRVATDGVHGADLTLVCGHGDEDGIAVGVGVREDAVALQDQLGQQVGCVVVASCGSAASPGPDRPSIALATARRGRAIVVGFQGSKAALHHVEPFVRAVATHLASRLRGEQSATPVVLRDWEVAITAARGQAGSGAVAPVVYVHPSALAGRSTTDVRRPTTGAHGRRRRHQRVVAIPWYVPGQVAWVAVGGRVLRLPLPVDIGTRVRVTIAPPGLPGAGNHVVTVLPPPGWSGGASRAVALRDGDVRRLADAWAIADHGVAVEVLPSVWATRNDVRSWAPRSAELGAVARALAAPEVHDLPAMPTAVRGLLARLVAEEFGAPDAAPRLVEPTGRVAVSLGEWPGIAVRPWPGGVVPDNRPLSRADMLECSPNELADPGLTLAQVEDAMGRGTHLVELASRQAAWLAPPAPARLPPNLRAATRGHPRVAPVVFPYAAALTSADGHSPLRLDAPGAEATTDLVPVPDQLPR